MKRIVPLAIIAALAALAVTVAAFGATVLANPTDKFKLAYAKKNLTATHGLLTLRSKNTSSVLKHDISIRKGTSATGKVLVKGKVVGLNGVSVARVKLAKGKYRFFCSVPGHEQGGMWGILTVK